MDCLSHAALGIPGSVSDTVDAVLSITDPSTREVSRRNAVTEGVLQEYFNGIIHKLMTLIHQATEKGMGGA